MSIPLRRPALLVAALVAGLMLASRPAAAQRQVAMRTDAADSVSWVARRLPLHRAAAALRTRDGHAAVLLTDTTIVLQFTDRGLEHMRDHTGDGAQGTGGRVLARMLGAGLAELLDHGIAYRLSALRAAHAEDGRLVLEDHDGNRVFADTEINGRRVMDDFPAAGAERFAAAVDRAIRARR